jgi:hypothetical protein
MTQVVNNLSIQEQFELILADENKMRMHEFVNNLNISDVAELIEEYEDIQIKEASVRAELKKSNGNQEIKETI